MTAIKKPLTLLLAMMLALTLVPASAFVLAPAQAQALEMQAGTPTCTLGTASDTPTIVGFAGYEWLVIEQTGSRLRLLAKDNVFGSVPFNNTHVTYSYVDGELQQAMIDAYWNIVDPKERELVLARNIEAKNNGSGESIVANQYFWPLSVPEARVLNSNVVRLFPYGASPTGQYWWLRSASDLSSGTNATLAITSGGIDSGGRSINDSCAVRPAFDFNLAFVSFTSAASGTGSKSSISIGDGLVNVSAPSGAIKFTVLDYGLKFTCTDTASRTVKSGETVSIEYSNVIVAANTYVSCVIEDTSGAVLFYGKLSQAASGTVTFTVPAVADLPEGNYTIKIFSEEVNGDNFTDFCSASTSIPLIVDNAMPIHNIIYKNYDGADLVITDPTYPLTYTEGTGLVLPVSGPEGWMPGYDFLGFFDCQLDPNQKVPIPGTEYERLDFDIGTKILGISESATSDVTLYLRPYSDVVSMSINDNELYLFAAPGVFPNGTTADIRALEPGTQEYQDALKNIDITNLGNVKIAAFEVFDSLENKIQPISFFGDAVIGFMIPEGFSLDALSLIMVLPGADITLTSKIWTDPEDANLHYIEGTTEHFSLFALLDTSPLDNPQTSDMHSLAWLLVLSSMVLGALCIILSRRRERLEDL